ncbi:MAG: hypothetical protein RJA22_2593 [Verrucomicrobiota bacterium]
MLVLADALERMRREVPLRPVEWTPPAGALGRVVAADIPAPRDLPPFDNSAMDGYAVRAADTAGARPEAPVGLRVLGSCAAGQVFAGEVGPGTCVRVFTGSVLPAGADAVIMQEDTAVDPARPGEVRLLDAARPWENVRFRGEDVKQGTPVLRAGDRLNALRLGLLAALGLDRVATRRPPVVGLLATGSELLEPGQPWEPGRIFESNRLTLTPLVARTGAIPRLYPLVPDTLAATRAALEQAFADCDAVLTTGGVSVGELDFVKAAFADLGGTTEFWKVAIRPGKPFVFGRHQDRFLFGLPGNPVSAVVTFLLLVRPLLLHWQGATDTDLPAHPGVLAEPLANHGDRRHFLRVVLEPGGAVRPAGAQNSHLLGSLARANGLVDVPPHTTWPSGTAVTVLAIDP